MGRVNVDELAHLREERGLSLGQIALRMGVSEGYLSYVCMEHGIVRRGRKFVPGKVTPGAVVQRAGRLVRTFTPEEDEQLLCMALQGESRMEIARQLGRNQSSIRGRLLTLARHQEMGVRA